MADPFFPNVPDVPGVPPVNRLGAFDEPDEPALSSSGKESQADQSRQWGLFTQGGQPAAPADNVVAIDVALEARISDYPVEKGGFGSYNKVIVPFDIRLTMTKGGSVDERQAFQKAVMDAYRSTDLFNVITPENVWLDVNVVTVREARAADRGNGLLTLELGLRQIRQTAKLTFSKTQDPASAEAVNDGSVQTQEQADAQQYEGAAG